MYVCVCGGVSRDVICYSMFNYAIVTTKSFSGMDTGPTHVPESASACRQAAADRLVESLAPFLIVAAPNVFFGYGWFYNLEDGYIPCKTGVQCGMPEQWFPEYSRPLGTPRGAAQTDVTRTIWTREFEHASVFVNLTNRAASRIEWHPVGDLPVLVSTSMSIQN